jgi:hypothetical protein
MRRFELHRDVDISTISGVGIVAEGVIFTDGSVALRWLSDRPTTTTFNCIEDVEAIHCHGGLSRIVFLDKVPGFTLTGRAVPPNGRPRRFAN